MSSKKKRGSSLEKKRKSSLPAVKKNKSVVSYDPLSAYLREMKEQVHLTPEQEHELAVAYVEQKDIEAAYKLVASNLWLVVKLAREYEKSAKNLLDLIQEGNIGLMEAVKGYDPYKGVRFPSYAVWWIKAYIIRYMIANLRMVKIGTTQAQRKLYFNLNKEKAKLERMGISPRPKLLAEKLNVKESEVVEMEQRLGSSDLSVDAPQVSTESDFTLHSVLPSEGPSSEDLLADKQKKKYIRKAFKEFSVTLKKKQRLIFEKRMVTEDKSTLQELSDELGISKERVRQIQAKLASQFKLFFEEKLKDSGDEPGFL